MGRRITDEKLMLDIVVNGDDGRKAINDFTKANRELKTENKELNAERKKLVAQGKKESEEYKNLTKEVYKNNKSIRENNEAIKKTKEQMDLTQLTMKELRAEKRRLAQAKDGSVEGTEEWKKFNNQLKKVEGRIKEVRLASEETGDEIDEMNESFDSMGELFTGLTTGNIPMLRNGLRGVAGNIKSITRAAIAFIATPIGLALAALGGIVLTTKAWIDFNLEAEKTNQLVRDMTQESGSVIDGIRIRAEALKDIFGTDLEDSIGTAKSLVKNLGITYDEAFDIIEDGGIRGKLKNDEFLDSLKEYPVQFKNAGFSAKEFGAIVNTGIDLSIYQDKLPDAIKEFTLSVTEQTDAAREALENAFGKDFTDQLFNNIRVGAITPKEALQEIAIEAEQIGLNSQQAQLLTADLFKGAGEDAGGALKVFEAVNIALNDQQKPLTEIQELQKDQLEQTQRLKGLYTGLFATADGGFGKLVAKGKLFGTKILIGILEAGIGMYNWIVDLNNEIGVLSGLFTGLGNAATLGFRIVWDLLKNTIEGFKGFGDVVKGVFTLDTELIQSGFKQAISTLPNFISDAKDRIVGDMQEVWDAIQGKNKLERVNIDDFLSESTGGLVPGQNEPAADKIEGNKQAELAFNEKKQMVDQELELEQKKSKARIDLEKRTIDEIGKLGKSLHQRQEVNNKVQAINEQNINKKRLSSYSAMFGGITQLLGKNTRAGKAAAGAQATMNTWQGVTEVWKTPSVLKEPFATISRIINTATVVASGLGAVREIGKTSVPGYERGRYPILREDGKMFSSEIRPSAFTQMVTRPTYFSDRGYLAGENGSELIVDHPTLMSLRPGVIDEIYATHARVRGYESGKYDVDPSASVQQDNSEGQQTNSQLFELLLRINYRLDNPLPSPAYLSNREANKISQYQSEIDQARAGAIVS